MKSHAAAVCSSPLSSTIHSEAPPTWTPGVSPGPGHRPDADVVRGQPGRDPAAERRDHTAERRRRADRHRARRRRIDHLEERVLAAGVVADGHGETVVDHRLHEREQVDAGLHRRTAPWSPARGGRCRCRRTARRPGRTTARGTSRHPSRGPSRRPSRRSRRRCRRSSATWRGARRATPGDTSGSRPAASNILRL